MMQSWVSQSCPFILNAFVYILLIWSKEIQENKQINIFFWLSTNKKKENTDINFISNAAKRSSIIEVFYKATS